MATIDTVKEVLEENLDINPESVNDDSTCDSLGIDSLDMVDLRLGGEVRRGLRRARGPEDRRRAGRVHRLPVSRKAYRAR